MTRYLAVPAVDFLSELLHLAHLDFGFLFADGATEGGHGAFRLVLAQQPARRFAEEERADEKHQARVDDGEKHASPCVILRGLDELRIAGSGLDRSFCPLGIEVASESSDDDAKGKHELEDGGALAAAFGAQAFGQVERHHDGDHADRHALQQSPQKQGDEALRQDDQGHAADEHESTDDHHCLAAEPVRENPGNQGGGHAAAQDGSDKNGCLFEREIDGLVEVQQRCGDNAYVDAVEQTAQAGDKKQKPAIEHLVGRRCGHLWDPPEKV